MHLTLTPPYGRDFRSAKEAEAAWKAGKDFILHTLPFTPLARWNGKPCSVRDIDSLREEHGISAVKIRYNNRRQETLVPFSS